jgi:glycosyl transferase, family 25
LAQLPKTWQLLYLGYEKNDTFNFTKKLKSLWYQIFPKHVLLKLLPKQYKKYYAKPLTQNIWHSGFHDCTHAYAITLNAAKQLIKMQTPVTFKSDTLLSFAVSLGSIEGYIAKPKLFDQLSIQQNAPIQSLLADK